MEINEGRVEVRSEVKVVYSLDKMGSVLRVDMCVWVYMAVMVVNGSGGRLKSSVDRNIGGVRHRMKRPYRRARGRWFPRCETAY